MEEKKGRDTLSRFFRNVVLILAAWWLINNMTVLGAVLSKVTNILLPFIIGGAIAFIINIPMSFFEKHMGWIKIKVIRRILAIILSPLTIINIGVDLIASIPIVVSFLQIVAYVIPWTNILPIILLIIALFIFRIVLAFIKTVWKFFALFSGYFIFISKFLSF